MRPITKPNPVQINVPGGNNVPAYGYYLDAHLTNTQINFTAAAVRASYNHYNQNAAFNRRVHRLLDDLLKRALGNVTFPGGTQQDNTRAANNIRNRLTEPDANPPGYRSANPQLDARTGHYCAFCEIAKPGHEIAVEHRIPKTPYPVTFVWWGNFLQVCSRCNSAKGDRPTRANAAAFVLAPDRATAYAPPPLPAVWANASQERQDEQDVMQMVLERHFWPDLDPYSFRRIQYQMQDARNNYAAIPSDRAARRLPNAGVTFYNYAVTANMRLGNDNTVTQNVVVEVVALTRATQSQAAAQQATQAAQAAAQGAGSAAAARTAAARAAADISPAIGIAVRTAAQGPPNNVASVADRVSDTPAVAAATQAYSSETRRTRRLTGLDVLGSARAGYRTYVWFDILGLIANWENQDLKLMGIPHPDRDVARTATFETMWYSLLKLAVGRGFYSTFIELLQQFPDPAYAPHHNQFATLADRFIYDTNPANIGGPFATIPGNQFTTIPGTDTANIP